MSYTNSECKGALDGHVLVHPNHAPKGPDIAACKGSFLLWRQLGRSRPVIFAIVVAPMVSASPPPSAVPCRILVRLVAMRRRRTHNGSWTAAKATWTGHPPLVHSHSASFPAVHILLLVVAASGLPPQQQQCPLLSNGVSIATAAFTSIGLIQDVRVCHDIHFLNTIFSTL